MKLSNAIEGGLTGAATLLLLQQTLRKIDIKAAEATWLKKNKLVKYLKRHGIKNSGNNSKKYVQLAGELLSNAAYFGLIGTGKNKNAVLPGGLLGAVAGLRAAFMPEDDEADPTENPTKKKILTIALYTLGGLLAGKAMQKIDWFKKKGSK